ncbi:arylsulfatase A-like enzyme [Scopulibacillus darangshiensis]|uniref:Arylsulfatase A-like enzyme n=1 Tax=Scopulibacillus darangshiensis TaxID=442528 RepID=A0A4R2NLB1_9BACL|nr:arylsulfatase [Scopulibacillus darangshiensis]TCP22330.1 arylsulfatase A-like enzyme [Scopulibacillus darangshiensis]
MTKPNVLLIMVDQMRADCLSILDHPAVDTPNLDQLARTGTLFKNAYSATPSCVPARASLLTGMSQTSTGRVGYQDKVPWNYEHTLAGEFTKAGYHTQCVGKMHTYPARNLCGFHHVVLHDGYLHYNRFKHINVEVESYNYGGDDYLPWLKERAGSSADLNDLGLDCNASTVARPWHLPEAWHPTNWVVSESIDFLRRRDPSKPFFLKMSFVRPHPPFDPPQAFFDMYKDADLPDPAMGDWADINDLEKSGLDPTTSKGSVPKNRFKRAQAAYYALITHIDYQIGRFLMAMKEHGVLNNTVILFASDHGELLGDHHLFRKSLPYEGSANIPFILSDPGNVLKGKRNHEIEEVVEIRDIMPTLLDAAGVSIPKSVDGKSVLPLCSGANIKWRDYLHGEHAAGDTSHHYVTNGKEKYIWFSQTGEEQLFDLVNDPQEIVNLADAAEYSDRLTFWRGMLIKELAGREEGYTDGEQLIVGAKPKATLDHVFISEKTHP